MMMAMMVPRAARIRVLGIRVKILGENISAGGVRGSHITGDGFTDKAGVTHNERIAQTHLFTEGFDSMGTGAFSPSDHHCRYDPV